MIARVIGWSIDNRFLVLLLTALIIGWGLYAVRGIPLDAIPDLSDVQVIVKTTYPGQAPQGGGGPGHLSGHQRVARRARGGRRCAAIPCTAIPMSTSSSATVPISTGRAPGCLEQLSQVADRLPAAAPARISAPTRRPWAGCTSTPWWTGAGRARPGAASQPAGLVPQVRAAVVPGSRRSQPSAAWSSSTRSWWTPRCCAPTTCRWRT